MFRLPSPSGDSSGNIVMADGMEAEFELASAKRLTLSPVACTGTTAPLLHKRALDRFSDYYPAGGYKRLFQDLEKMGTAQQVAKRVVALIERLRDRRA